MAELILHPTTRLQLQGLIDKPQQSVLITGPCGVGKGSVVSWLAASLLDISHETLTTHPYLTIINRGKEKSISIEAVRNLEHFLSLKVPSRSTVNRIVIIEDSHTLSHDAQNALLKTLEEPPIGTIILMTAVSEEGILPTVRSRLAKVRIRPASTNELITFFTKEGHSSESVEQAATVSGGLPGLMTAILRSNEHELMPAISKAKELLGMTPYERLIQIDALSKDKQLVSSTLFVLQQMAEIQLGRLDSANSERWSRILQLCFEVEDALVKSGQSKLVLSHLMLSL